MRRLVLLGKSSKSIAIGLELIFLENSNSSSCQIVIIRSLKMYLKTSLLFKYLVLRLSYKNIKFLFPRRSFLSTIWPVIAAIFSIKVKKSSSFVFKEIDLNALMKAHYAAKLGTDDLELSRLGTLSLMVSTWRVISLIEIATKCLASTDILVAFNGRELLESSFVAVARSLGKKVLLTEKGAGDFRYKVYQSSPHNNLEWWDNLEKFSRDPLYNEKLHSLEVKEFLEKKSQGLDVFAKKRWADYLTESFVLPTDFLRNEYVVFFSVSTAEVSPFPDFMPNMGFQSQFEALRALIQVCEGQGMGLILRRHPNSIGTDGIDREEKKWLQIVNEHPNVVYFSPRNAVNSYDIAKRARAVFTWRSTIGVDTLYLERPTFALGAAKWARHREVQAFSIEDLREKVINPGEAFVLAAREFAAYLCEFGIEYKLFKSVDRWGIVDNVGKFYPFYSFHKTRSALRKVSESLIKNRV